MTVLDTRPLWIRTGSQEATIRKNLRFTPLSHPILFLRPMSLSNLLLLSCSQKLSSLNCPDSSWSLPGRQAGRIRICRGHLLRIRSVCRCFVRIDDDREGCAANWIFGRRSLLLGTWSRSEEWKPGRMRCVGLGWLLRSSICIQRWYLLVWLISGLFEHFWF